METILATAFGRRVDFQRGETDDISNSVRLLLKQNREDAILNFIAFHSELPSSYGVRLPIPPISNLFCQPNNLLLDKILSLLVTCTQEHTVNNGTHDCIYVGNFPLLLPLMARGYLKSEQGRAGKYLVQVAFDLVKARRESAQAGKVSSRNQERYDMSKAAIPLHSVNLLALNYP